MVLPPIAIDMTSNRTANLEYLSLANMVSGMGIGGLCTIYGYSSLSTMIWVIATMLLIWILKL